MVGYLALPRPRDMTKGVIAPVAFGIGAAGAGGVDRETLVRAAVVWVLLELMIYQARYQWNDIRGFVADQNHPGKADRGRLPGPLEARRSRTAVSGSVAAAKMVTALGVATALPRLALLRPVVGVASGVFGVAVAYEALRSRATGRSEAVPAEVTPSLVALYLVVGVGYAVRGFTGLALATEVRPALAVAAAACLWSYGVGFVTSRWAVEATAYGLLRDSRLVWRTGPQQGREHSTALIRWLPTSVAPQDWSDPTGVPSDGSLNRWRAVWPRTSLWAPWNLAAVAAGAAAGATGTMLADPTASVRQAGTAAVVGALAAAGVVLAGRARCVVGAGEAAAAAAALTAAGVPRPLVTVLPWAAVMAAHMGCARQCADTLGKPLAALSRLTGRGRLPVTSAPAVHPVAA